MSVSTFLQFSHANAKLRALANTSVVRPFLGNRRKVFSFDLLSGHTCPHAHSCLSKSVSRNGRVTIQDGPDTEFRCFSASQEASFPSVYRLRQQNFLVLRQKTLPQMVKAIEGAMPDNLGVCRIHVAGDFFSQVYFDAWCEVARSNEDRLFYAYTKSIPYWVARLDSIPRNLSLTASRGGRRDSLIDEYALKQSIVVFSQSEADIAGLDVDHDDSHAADQSAGDFALMIHGTQPKGSAAADAIRELRRRGVRFSYSRT